MVNYYQLRRSLLLALAVFAFVAVAQAADYPSYPIHVIVPYSPGGSSDVPMRAIAQQMSTQMDQSIVVENKPGRLCSSNCRSTRLPISSRSHCSAASPACS
jgi:hypothetical protein